MVRVNNASNDFSKMFESFVGLEPALNKFRSERKQGEQSEQIFIPTLQVPTLGRSEVRSPGSPLIDQTNIPAELRVDV